MKREPEPLEIERLIRADQRHSVSVADHQQWREDLAASQAAQQAQPDPIDDELEADPIFDRLPERRSTKSTSRLLGILDQLNREGTK